MLQFATRKLHDYDLIIPEVLKSLRRHRRIAHSMLNVLMPQIILNGAGIMPVRRQVIPARMPQLVGMGHKGQTGQLARSCHDLANGTRRQGRFSFRHEHIRGAKIKTLEFPQQPQLWTP
jgi:hypothetical protein